MQFSFQALMGALVLFSVSVHAQQQPTNRQILFLGTAHFAGSSDVLSLNMADVSSPERQQEIQQLVNSLVQFKPDKVILEYPYGNQKLDSTYREYVQGNHELTMNERQQLGFRIAEKLGHNHIYAADKRMDLPFDAMMKFLKKDNRMEAFNQLLATLKAEGIDPMQEYYNRHTISDFFLYLNREAIDRMNRQLYLEYFNAYGTAQNAVGVEVTAKWWERNFHIMAHIDRITEPGNRVLVIFGQGHTALLKPFYRDRDDVSVVSLTDYLPPE